MRLSRRQLLSGFAPLVARAQDSRFSVETKVVNVFSTVRDERGRIVRGLRKEDFVLEEDGRPQTIRYFSAESNAPLTVGLLVDISSSMMGRVSRERDGCLEFLGRCLRSEKDRAFLISFNHEVELLQDLTASRVLLEKGLDRLPPARGETAIFDAVYLGAEEVMQQQPGLKAIVVLSDGVGSGLVRPQKAVEAAQRADTSVYGILYGHSSMRIFGPERLPPYPSPYGRMMMELLSRPTGGRVFEVREKLSKQPASFPRFPLPPQSPLPVPFPTPRPPSAARGIPIERIFATIEEDLRNQYSLGYTSDAGSAPGYRRIQVRTVQKDLVVRARDGYYAS